jgi:hypothetical protein
MLIRVNAKSARGFYRAGMFFPEAGVVVDVDAATADLLRAEPQLDVGEPRGDEAPPAVTPLEAEHAEMKAALRQAVDHIEQLEATMREERRVAEVTRFDLAAAQRQHEADARALIDAASRVTKLEAENAELKALLDAASAPPPAPPAPAATTEIDPPAPRAGRSGK